MFDLSLAQCHTEIHLRSVLCESELQIWNWRFSLGFGTWLTKCVAGTGSHSSVEYSGLLFHSLGWASRSHGGSPKG